MLYHSQNAFIYFYAKIYTMVYGERKREKKCGAMAMQNIARWIWSSRHCNRRENFSHCQQNGNIDRMKQTIKVYTRAKEWVNGMSVPAIKLAFVRSNMQNTRAKKKKTMLEKNSLQSMREREKKPSGNMVAEKKKSAASERRNRAQKNDYTWANFMISIKSTPKSSWLTEIIHENHKA